MLRTMLFLTVLRREAARAIFESLSRTVAFDIDRVASRYRRSRGQHLRNGVGALLHGASRVAWRPTPFVSLFYLLRENVTSDFSYGVNELGHAFSPPAVLRKPRSLLAVSPVVAAVAVVIARSRNGGESDDAVTVVAAPTQAEPANVAG
jgi:hypothetical protein